MNRLSFQTRVAGHPISVLVAGSLAALSLCVFVTNAEAWPMLVISGMMMHKVMEAHNAVVAYKDWQAAWDAMAPNEGQRPGSRRWLAVLVLGLFAACMAVALDSDAMRHAVSVAGPIAFVLGLIVLPVLGVRWLWRRRRLRHRSFVVTVIARRTMPSPKLADAYAALPAYCHALLGGQQ